MDNEEVKRKGEWAYTGFGKRVRGLICMLTFFVLMILAGLIFLVIWNYGLKVITDPHYDFYDSNEYKNRLRDEAVDVLNCVRSLDENKDTFTFSIIDVEKSAVNHYDYEKIAASEPELDYINNPEILKDYIVSSTKLTDNFYDYDYAAKVIRQMDDNSFIYFSDDAFKRIFIKDGVTNEDHRFSEELSESAYFIYRDPAVMNALKDMEGVELEAYFGIDTNSGDVSLSYYDYESMIYEKTGTRLMDADYAAYDPEYALFYSTWDDYFNENTDYMYEAGEIESYLDNSEFTGGDISSIIFPVLWSKNYSDIMELVAEDYVNPEEFEERLQEKSGSAFCYYAELNGSTYGNVSSPEAVAVLDSSYIVGEVKEGMYEPSNSLSDLFLSDVLVENLNGSDSNGYMYFGLLAENLQIEDTSDTAQFVWGYEKIVKKLFFIIVCAVIFLALLMWQAVGLIRTTGREVPGDKDRLMLNGFDRLYTELWFIISVGVLAGSGELALLLVKLIDGIMNGYFANRSSAYIMYSDFVMAFCALLPGLSFMELTLSFARRIKARNIKNKLYIRVVWREVNQWLKEKKSTDKLKMITALYIGLQALAIVVVEILSGSGVGSPGVHLLAVSAIMLAAWIGLAWFVKCVGEDLGELKKGIAEITRGNFDEKVVLKRRRSLFRDLAGGINHISDGLKNAVETSIKDERMKTELITNVSHDLKTPLTSIINYINLLKREKMPTPEAEHYVEVLDSKAHRLSQLTEDLAEAAKATSGNIELEMMPLSFVELLNQALGEFEDKFAEKELKVLTSYHRNGVKICEGLSGQLDVDNKASEQQGADNKPSEQQGVGNKPLEQQDADNKALEQQGAGNKPSDNVDNNKSVQSAMVIADGRRLFRILDNVLQNAYKYAMEGTRIYIELTDEAEEVRLVMKNISKAPLNISADELMERFTRGDASRTTEGSGLGLSIAKDLTRLMGGSFEIELDGDLFKVILTFPEYVEEINGVPDMTIVGNDSGASAVDVVNKDESGIDALSKDEFGKDALNNAASDMDERNSDTAKDNN